jgi:hypothetical protein
MKPSVIKIPSICAVILGHAQRYRATRLRSILHLHHRAKQVQALHTTVVDIVAKNSRTFLNQTGTAGLSI